MGPQGFFFKEKGGGNINFSPLLWWWGLGRLIILDLPLFCVILLGLSLNALALTIIVIYKLVYYIRSAM